MRGKSISFWVTLPALDRVFPIETDQHYITINLGCMATTVTLTLDQLARLRDLINQAIALATTPPDIDPAAEAAEAEMLAAARAEERGE